MKDLTKEAGEVPETSLPEILRALHASLSRGRRRQLRLVLALMVLGAITELLTIGAVLPFLASIADPAAAPGRLGGLFRSLLGGGGEDLVWRATALLVGVTLLAALVRLLILRVTQRFVFMVGHEIGQKVFARMLRQPYRLHVERNSSEMTAGIDKVQTMIGQVLLPLMHALVAATIAPAIIALMIAIAPATAAVAAAATILIYVGLTLATGGRLRANARVAAAMASARMKAVQEGLGGLRDILIEHSQEVFEARFNRLDSAYRNAQASNAFVSMAPRYVVEAAGIVAIGLLALHMSGQPGGIIAAIPVLGTLALGAQRLLPLLQTAYSGWSAFTGNYQVLRDLLALMRAPVVASRRVRDPVPFREDVVFHRVGLRYSDGTSALAEISLRIAKGELIGLVGRTGSGKSSFLDLLMGLLEPTSGEIRIDGRRLDEAGLPNWQAQIAHVPQSIYLADASIASNIAFAEAARDIDMPRVRLAARRAQIDAFIAQCPMGYESRVGERGIRLSGGQRQRIAIARAFYKRATILILDEATGQLDPETENEVTAAISAIDRDITIVVVAHRDSALAPCDRIVRLDAGRLVEPRVATNRRGTFDTALPRGPIRL